MAQEIKILPIFDQAAPGVWDDFVRIRIDTRVGVYNDTYLVRHIQSAYDEHKVSWRKFPMNVAFGAYDGAEMIGFIQGECCGPHAKICNLYVLPAYRGARIGRRLLTMAESAASIQARDMHLISLGGACTFYENMQYTSPINSNVYSKKINGGGYCQVLPVFKSNAAVLRACDEICANAISDKVRDRTVPMFVYVNAANRINGLLVGSKADDKCSMHIAPHQPADWIGDMLTRGFDSYIALQHMRGACSTR